MPRLAIASVGFIALILGIAAAASDDSLWLEANGFGGYAAGQKIVKKLGNYRRYDETIDQSLKNAQTRPLYCTYGELDGVHSECSDAKRHKCNTVKTFVVLGVLGSAASSALGCVAKRTQPFIHMVAAGAAMASILGYSVVLLVWVSLRTGDYYSVLTGSGALYNESDCGYNNWMQSDDDKLRYRATTGYGVGWYCCTVACAFEVIHVIFLSVSRESIEASISKVVPLR